MRYLRVCEYLYGIKLKIWNSVFWEYVGEHEIYTTED